MGVTDKVNEMDVISKIKEINQTNQINEIDETDQTNQINEINEIDEIISCLCTNVPQMGIKPFQSKAQFQSRSAGSFTFTK
jgi:hypothetical protein